MNISRRTVLRSTGAGLLALGGTTAASCSVAPAAGRFLATVVSKLAEGFGLKAGEVAAEQLPDVVTHAIKQLPTDVGERVGSAVYGFASNVIDRTNLRAAVAANFKLSEEFEDDKLRSYAVHLNANGYITAPAVVTLGLALLAEKERETRLKDLTEKQRQANLPAIHAELRDQLSINVYELVDGSDQLDEFGIYRTVTSYGRNIEVEWDPTDSKTEQCRLTVRRGLVIKGRPATWETQHDIHIPSQFVWGDFAST
jgi:hypothetical protein